MISPHHSRRNLHVDRTLTCRDCGQTFTFTAGEQSFYAERGYTEPQRCQACRAARKAQRNEGGYGDGGGYGRSERTMHPAVCGNCGKETEVPFVPTLDKPV